MMLCVAAALAAGMSTDAAAGTAYLARTSGHLDVWRRPSGETYQVYFHVPLATEHQAPLLLTVTSPQLVDWRFVRLEPPNVLAVATMRDQGSVARLDWEAWVLLRSHRFEDRPLEVPLAALADAPAEVREWLAPTACVQWQEPLIVDRAAAVRGAASTVDELAEAITDDVYFNVAGVAAMTHVPHAFDAFYAFTWGGSCTSHAHAAAALLRANGVSARNVLVVPRTVVNLDMHWLVEYWLPGYGWVRTEPTFGFHPVETASEIKTFVVQPHDEFPIFFVNGIDAMWHTSDPALGRFNPAWGGAHESVRVDFFEADDDWLADALERAREIFERTVDLQGTRLEPARRAWLDTATSACRGALEALRSRDLAGFDREQRRAIHALTSATPRQPLVVWRDDLEGDTGGWRHGGTADEWELGRPTVGPPGPHSGERCWTTDLDHTYESGADTWLESPELSLEGLASAALSVWLFCRVDDLVGPVNDDRLWLEIGSDATGFVPISSPIVGGNDDPAIPDVRGWSRLVLDLTEHIGPEPRRLRFRFVSNRDGVQDGCSVDDLEVTGRPAGSGVAPRRPADRVASESPDP